MYSELGTRIFVCRLLPILNFASTKSYYPRGGNSSRGKPTATGGTAVGAVGTHSGKLIETVVAFIRCRRAVWPWVGLDFTLSRTEGLGTFFWAGSQKKVPTFGGIRCDSSNTTAGGRPALVYEIITKGCGQNARSEKKINFIKPSQK